MKLDSEFASAYGMAAWCYFWRRLNHWMTDTLQDTAEATRLAGRAAELGKDDAVALSYSGLVLGFIAGDLEAGVELIDRALVLNPNLAIAWTAKRMPEVLSWRPRYGDRARVARHAAMPARSADVLYAERYRTRSFPRGAV